MPYQSMYGPLELGGASAEQGWLTSLWVWVGWQAVAAASSSAVAVGESRRMPVMAFYVGQKIDLIPVSERGNTHSRLRETWLLSWEVGGVRFGAVWVGVLAVVLGGGTDDRADGLPWPAARWWW